MKIDLTKDEINYLLSSIAYISDMIQAMLDIGYTLTERDINYLKTLKSIGNKLTQR